MQSMRPIVKYGLAAVGLLLVVLLVYLRPLWWETYRYENDRIRVRLHGTQHNELQLPRAGTLVIRLTGPGRSQCSMIAVSRKTAGPASEAPVTFKSVSSEFSDEAGYASAPMHRGLGRGKRGLLGGCQRSQAYLLILSRPSFETRVVIPHVAKLNTSGQVIRRPLPKKETTSALDHARTRALNALRVLYPTRIYSAVGAGEQDEDRTALMSTAEYWQHILPDGRTVRSYALENLVSVIDALDCPRMQEELSEIFQDTSIVPESEEAILAEHNALMPVLYSWGEPAITSCALAEGSGAGGT